MVTKTIQAIKEGQIYSSKYSNYKIVIKSVTPTKIIAMNDKGHEDLTDIADCKAINFCGMELIARYSTFQEAVNSKEFNNAT